MKKPLTGLLLAGAAVAIPAAINTIISSRVSRLEQPLPGDIGYYDWIYGRVAFYRLGQGMPLLLVHNPNAGGSTWEWRKVFPELANRFTVYAIDLLGYGLSDKPNLRYSGAMYADLIHDFLQDVVGERANAIGSALGSSYLVNVAVRRPEILDRLVLVNASGCTTNLAPAVETLTAGTLRTPVLGTSMYYTLVSRTAIAEELTSHIYYDPTLVTPDVVDLQYQAAHQPGSQYAAAGFVTGQLDLPMRLAFSLLTQPVQLVWGRQAYYTPETDAIDLLYRHPQARLEVFDECGMLPHDEQAGRFLRLVEDFLAEPIEGEMAA